MRNKLRVDILCTGLDRIRRGYESFARECFDSFRDDEGVDVRLYKGNGPAAPKEQSLFCLHRNLGLAKLVGSVSGRSSYHVEQLSFLVSYLSGPARRNRPDIVFTSDANLANFLSRWRRRAGAGCRILYSNGGPVDPPFPEYDHVQQVALPYYEQAIEAGEPRAKHSLVPYGINVPEDLAAGHFPDAGICRAKLDLPQGRKILLSVGYVSARHKRMDYVVKEVAQVSEESRPFLLLVGQQDESTAEIAALAEALLGSGNYRIASAPYAEMKDYYGSADAFVLASLKEGFGRVLLEASSFGLPCAVDDNPVMRYVLEGEGFYGDMQRPGALAELIPMLISDSQPVDARRRRVREVQRRFGWQNLKTDYLQMFQNAVAESLPLTK